MPPARRAAPLAPELALARALELGAGAVGVAAGLAASVAAAVGGRELGAGVAAGGVLALVFMWVTRVAVLRARAADASAIALWVLISYGAKFVLVLVTTALVARAGDVGRGGYGVTLLVGVVVSVLAQTLLTRPRRTLTLDGLPSSTSPSARDDDAAARAAVAARAGGPAGLPQADSVSPR